MKTLFMVLFACFIAPEVPHPSNRAPDGTGDYPTIAAASPPRRGRYRRAVDGVFEATATGRQLRGESDHDPLRPAETEPASLIGRVRHRHPPRI